MRLEVVRRSGSVLRDLASANRVRPRALRTAFLNHGSDYIRRMVKDHMSGRGGANAGLSGAALAGLSRYKRGRAIAKARAGLGKGSLGLNRVTGHAARGWHRIVTGSGRELTLVVFTNVPYVAYHADDYQPKGQPRRHPPRLPSGAVWDEMAAGPDLEARLAALVEGS